MEHLIQTNIDLLQWSRSSSDERLKAVEKIICLIQQDLPLNLSFDMPSGYETAFGTYDPVVKQLFINRNQLQQDGISFLWYFLHELRHAIQYQYHFLFSDIIQLSLPYVIQYNGLCFKLQNGQWHSIPLNGSEEYFTELYLCLPYELDANQFALNLLQQASCIEQYSDELKHLQNLWFPKYSCFPEAEAWTHLQTVFHQIDSCL